MEVALAARRQFCLPPSLALAGSPQRNAGQRTHGFSPRVSGRGEACLPMLLRKIEESVPMLQRQTHLFGLGLRALSGERPRARVALSCD